MDESKTVVTKNIELNHKGESQTFGGHMAEGPIAEEGGWPRV